MTGPNPFPRPTPHSLYVDDMDRDQPVGMLVLNNMNPRPRGHPQGATILKAAKEWLLEHKPPHQDLPAWLMQLAPSEPTPGLEALIESNEAGRVVIPFDNGLAADLAQELSQEGQQWTDRIVLKAYEFAFTEDRLVKNLESEYKRSTGTQIHLSSSQREAAQRLFPLLRVQSQTFRAVHRLSILGVITDYTYDYNSKTVTASLQRLPPGGYLDNLRNYVARYVSKQDAERIAEQAVIADQPTELRRCFHGLLGFVYDRFARQREEALMTMERTVRAGINYPKAFTEQVNLYFDSRYTTDLRPYLKECSTDIVFLMLERTRGEPHEIAHLLGSCNRLIEENPENGAFRAMRAYAFAMTPAYSQKITIEEFEESLQLLKARGHCNRKEVSDFLFSFVEYVADADPTAVSPFEAVVVRDHSNWLRSFTSGLKRG